jgi:hypothetical protein
MPLESAFHFLMRLQSDASFRRGLVVAVHQDDQTARWSFIRDNGFDFSNRDLIDARELVLQLQPGRGKSIKKLFPPPHPLLMVVDEKDYANGN